VLHTAAENITKETGSFILNREHLTMAENKVPRNIFGLKKQGVTGGLRKLYNEELHNLSFSSNIITVIK
jgi:hypothetical protein